jgi:predicted nucleic acid-binding protein
MESIEYAALPAGSLVFVDSAPIIYVIESHPKFGSRFRPLFERHAAGEITFAISTVTIIEVLAGPLGKGDEALAERYRSVLASWQVVALSLEVAESAARLRASLKLKLPDAVQAASAISVNAAALVTHDRDFSGLNALPVLA